MPGGERPPPKVLARARALATHQRRPQTPSTYPMLALLIGVHVKTLRAAARDGRLPVTYDTRTTFRRLRARATPGRSSGGFGGRTIGRPVRPADRSVARRLTWASVPRDYDFADSRAASRARVEPSAIGHAGGRGAQSRRLPMGGAETHAVAPVLATPHRALHDSGQPLGDRIVVSQVQRAALIGAVNNTVVYQWEAARTRVPPLVRHRIVGLGCGAT